MFFFFCFWFNWTFNQWQYLLAPLLPIWDREPERPPEKITGNRHLQLLQLRCFQVQNTEEFGSDVYLDVSLSPCGILVEETKRQAAYPLFWQGT